MFGICMFRVVNNVNMDDDKRGVEFVVFIELFKFNFVIKIFFFVECIRVLFLLFK